MRSAILSAALALTADVYAAPTMARSTKESIVGDNLVGYMQGFKNARIDTSVGGQAICVSGTIDVTATADNVLINPLHLDNQTALTEFLVESIEINSTVAERALGGVNTISDTFGIYSQLCFPPEGINATTVQFLSHGLGSDHNYWNNAPGYSYADYAASQGYTTFSFDHLGAGQSDIPDPIAVAQIQMQIAVAHELIQLLRTGGVAGTNLKHVVGIGHSFGSFKTLGITQQYPADFDAVILTGFSLSTAGMLPGFAAGDLTIAAQADPLRFAELPNGYVTSASIQGTQYAFFRWPGFDPALLNLLEATKGTISIGEYFTMSSTFKPSPSFTGPVDVVAGENDLLNCDGNCYLPFNQVATVKNTLFPAASNGSSWYIAPLSGHFLNYHYSAPGAYQHMINFVKSNGF